MFSTSRSSAFRRIVETVALVALGAAGLGSLVASAVITFGG